MRNALVADATDDDTTFPRGTLVWVIEGPRPRDGRVKVLGHMIEGGKTTRRRHPSELDGLRVADFEAHQVPKDAVSWNPREKAPAWIAPLSYATPPGAGS